MNEPFLEAPPERKADTSDLFCFIRAERPCDASCVAYLVVQPSGEDYREQPWAQCLLLVNAHRGGKHLTILTNTAVSAYNAELTRAADEARRSGSGGQ